MLTPPDGFSQAALASTLAQRWELSVASMIYRPVGWGSHHWEVTTTDGGRHFVTVDEPVSFMRLRAALAAARELGLAFAVAPIPTLEGEPLAPIGERFAVALYPFVEGQSFSWGEFSSPAHERAVLDLLVAVHTSECRSAMVDDFTIPHRAALHPSAEVDCGPYALSAARLLADNASLINGLLSSYDDLVGRAAGSTAVLTHGEPHPGNTMLRDDGQWVLIDWDTALLAPPERDLWMLDASLIEAYEKATGIRPLPEMLELYRLRWDIADIAVDANRFRKPHMGNLDDEKSWELLRRRLSA